MDIPLSNMDEIRLVANLQTMCGEYFFCQRQIMLTQARWKLASLTKIMMQRLIHSVVVKLFYLVIRDEKSSCHFTLSSLIKS